MTSDQIRVATIMDWWIVTRNGQTVDRFPSEREAEDAARELRYHCECGHEDYCGSGCGGHTE